jgi:CheY-like chemotaxis protein
MIAEGALACLSKPFDPSALSKAVAEALRK